ncbi:MULTISPECIES: hypothetical protein [Polaromonas]|uniref:Integrase n=1 Tax=Polaromonas aquatica TaxID=332657 RepID=A0ABW1TYS1_9BURK
MSTSISSAKSGPQQFAALDQALKNFDRLSVRPPAGQPAHAPDLDAAGAELPPLLARHISKALNTTSQGIPPEFANAWEWAASWVSENGVTLPPDTSYYRGLRNWFCYQVSMNKKNKLSAKSRALLAQHKIDLSKYRADNTGRGHRMDDDFYIHALRQHHAKHNTYDLNADCSPDLLQWQKRLLDSYFAGGTSTRMRGIALQLAGFTYGQWQRPGEAPIPSNQYSWWLRAGEFRIATQDRPAFRGRIDLTTPAHLREWASEQIGLAGKRQLSPRQRGELMTLNLITRSEHRLSQQKSVALAMARGTHNESQIFGKRERDLKTFLGATLLAHLLRSNAELSTVYGTLSIAPAQVARMRDELAPLMEQIVSLSTKTNLNALRKIYGTFTEEFEGSKTLVALPGAAIETLRPKQAKRIEQLANIVIQVRDAMRRINVRQDLARADALQ